MELTTTHKFLIVSGIAVILGWYLVRPKKNEGDIIVPAQGKSGAEKPKLTEKERMDILKEILAAKDSSLNASGKKQEELNITDYKLISDDELISIKKILDAEKKHKIGIRDGSSLERFMKNDEPQTKDKKMEDPLNIKTGTIDLAKVKFDLAKNVSDKDELEKQLTKYELNMDDMETAITAIAKIGMIASIPLLEGKAGKKISVIDSSESLKKKPAVTETKLGKKTMEECSPMADKLLKMEKEDLGKKFNAKSYKARKAQKQKLRKNIDYNCGENFFDEQKETWNVKVSEPKPLISKKRNIQSLKRKPARINTNYKSFSADDALIFS